MLSLLAVSLFLSPRVEVARAVALRALEESHGVGISVGIERGKVRDVFGVGVTEAGGKTPVGAETVFHVDSITKQLTAAAILSLQERGLLSLDDDVARYVAVDTHGARVTIRELLNHTSGLASYTDMKDPELERREVPPDEVLRYVASHPPFFAPGTSWRYSNSGFYLLGLVVERAAGKPWPAVLRERVFEPAGMTHAAWRRGDAEQEVAIGHEPQHDRLVPLRGLAWSAPFSAGAISATAGDLLSWESALDHGLVLSSASVAAMRTPTTLPDGAVIDYGFATRLGTLAGHRALGHTGSGNGYSAALLRLPDDDLTVVVLANATTRLPSALIAARIARAVLGLGELRAGAPPATLATPLEAFTGDWESDDGRVTVQARRGTLEVAGHPIRRLDDTTFELGNPDHIARAWMRKGRAEWILEYEGGMMTGAAYRLPK